MARSKFNPATSVTFRMPDGALEKLDKLEKNNSTLLAVIESNEHTIKRLLETISRQQ